jgi:hypothetical protein
MRELVLAFGSAVTISSHKSWVARKGSESLHAAFNLFMVSVLVVFLRVDHDFDARWQLTICDCADLVQAAQGHITVVSVRIQQDSRGLRPGLQVRQDPSAKHRQV